MAHVTGSFEAAWVVGVRWWQSWIGLRDVNDSRLTLILFLSLMKNTICLALKIVFACFVQSGLMPFTSTSCCLKYRNESTNFNVFSSVS